MRRLVAACLLLSAVPALAADPGGEVACERPVHSEETAPVSIDTRGAPTVGPKDAKVQVVVFSDFECPFCKRGAQTVKALEQKYGAQLQVVFMNQPLPRHEHARMAAAVALAAQKEGKFWELHDWLFAHQETLSRESVLAEAARLGLDPKKLASDLDTGVYEARIQADQEQAKRAGVEGTPTFFINGQKVQGAQPAEVISEIIDRELAR